VNNINVKMKADLKNAIPGLLLTLVIAIISFVTWWYLKGTWLKFSALLWAFIFSIIVVNIKPKLFEGRLKSGAEFSSTKLLRYAIALLGLTVNAAVWLKLWPIGVAVVLINLILVFGLGILICKYILKLDDALSLLIAVGTGICGASAIAAVGPALKAKAEQMGLAIAAITLFGLVAMFSYPLLYSGVLSGWLNNNPLAFGMWAGTGIHETAQVIAAASQVDKALAIATSAKFIRIFMIGPMVFVCLWLFRRFTPGGEKGSFKIAIPWFAIFFIVFCLLNTILVNDRNSDFVKSWSNFNSIYISPAITFLLAWAFAGVGLKVKIATIRSLGLKAFLGGMAVAIVAGVTSLLLVKFLWLPLQ